MITKKTLTEYLEYLEGSVYTKTEVDTYDFLNFEPKIGTGTNQSTISHTVSGLTLTVVNTPIFLGGYYTNITSSGVALPVSSTSYVYLERGANRNAITVGYTASLGTNSFSKVYVAKVVTNATTITTVTKYDIVPNADISNIVSNAKSTTSIAASATYTLDFANTTLRYKEGKSYFDTMVQVKVYDGTKYIINSPLIEVTVNGTGTTLSVKNIHTASLTVYIEIIG